MRRGRTQAESMLWLKLFLLTLRKLSSRPRWQ
jgi:hypothetical protein